jgi:hypothetical protein
MSSILKVDTIQDQSGNNIINENADTITIGASGDTITIPSGATLDASGATLTLPTTIEVDTIEPQSGTSLTLGASGDTITIPSGATLTNSGTATGFGVNTPAFFAKQTSAQSIANDTVVKIQNNSEDFDSDGTYDNVTNYRFTPAVAGKYFVFAQVAIDGSTDTDVYAWLYKNGSEFIQSNYFYRCTPFVSAIMDLTISDYVEVYAKQVSGTTRNSLASSRQNNFGAYKLIGA